MLRIYYFLIIQKLLEQPNMFLINILGNEVEDNGKMEIDKKYLLLYRD